MNTPTGGDASSSGQTKKLPAHPRLEHLQKQAKRLVKQNPLLKLAAAQHQLAGEYGFRNWAELARAVATLQGKALAEGDEELPQAARRLDLARVREILLSGSFTQSALNQALAFAIWYASDEDWAERKVIADVLVAHGADPHGEYRPDYGPLVFGTCECLSPPALQYLIEAGVDVSFVPDPKVHGGECPVSVALGTYNRGRNARKHRVLKILLSHHAYVPSVVSEPVLAIHRGDAGKLAALLEADPGLVSRRFADMPYGNMRLRGATLLHCAVEYGEIECLEVLFRHYADINMKADVIEGIGGQTPIFHAINTNCDSNFYTLEYLQKRVGQWIDMTVSATWNNYGKVQPKPMRPMEYAEAAATTESRQYRKHIDVEQPILRALDQGSNIKDALMRGDAPEVKRLLDEYPGLLTPSLWPVAIFQAKSLAMTRLLLDRGLHPDECSAPRKPLHLAVYQCLPEIVELLLARGADARLLNPLGERPLDLLDAYEPRPVGDPEAQRIRRALLKAGVKDDIFTVIRAGETDRLREMLSVDSSLLQEDTGFGGPLFVAARSARPEAARVLLEFGADPNQVNDKSNTPLWFAAQSPATPASARIAVMELLLAAGAEINRRCEDGTTALHFAAWRGPAEVVACLLSRGARNWIPDDKGRKPLDDARERSVAADKEKIVELLSQPRMENPHFRAAVAAASAGDLPELKRLLREHPALATAQAEENGEFAGPYFAHPYLLEFIAENPMRTRRIPANVCEVSQILIDAGAPQIALDKTLGLAASGSMPRECGVQSALLELLVKNGADPAAGLDGAISQGEKEAATILLRLGAVPGLVAAAGLGHAPRVRELVGAATLVEKERALSAAFQYDQQETAELLLESGIPLEREMLDYGTPLHHAAFYGRLALCRWLVERGADPSFLDRQWQGTPAGWAQYNGHPELAAWLQGLLSEGSS